jgi:hypothetical protein
MKSITTATLAAGEGLPGIIDLELAIEDVVAAANLMSLVEDAVLVQLEESTKKALGINVVNFAVFAFTEEQLDGLRMALRLVYCKSAELRRVWEDGEPAAVRAPGAASAFSKEVV